MSKDTNVRLWTAYWKKVLRVAKTRHVSGTAMLRIIVAEWLEEHQ